MSTPKEPNDKPSSYDTYDSDWLLRMMVSVVEADARKGQESSFEVMLLVGGLLVSGRMTDQRSYLKSIADGELYDILIKAVPELEINYESEEDDEDNLPSLDFIHLRNVNILTPSHPVISTETTPYWRCRLSAVDAFTFGGMSISVSTS